MKSAAIPLFVVAVAFCLAHRCSGELPADIEKCHAADVLCIARVTNDILRKSPHGNKGLGLGDLEPVHLDELLIARADGNSPLNLNFKLNDLDVFGLSKTNVTKLVGFEKDPRKSKFEVHVVIPQLTLRGKYEASGRILLLPIVGKGNAEIQLKNFKTGVKVKMNTMEDNGKLRMSVAKMKVQTDPERMTVKLENLFNGNKALGTELNNVINANWRDVWQELETGINAGYTDIVKYILEGVFKTISYDELYID